MTSKMNALEEHDIYYCAIDDFCSGNVDGFKRAVLLGLLQKYLPDILYLNGKELVEHLYEEANCSITFSYEPPSGVKIQDAAGTE